jgi:UDP-N-acetylmuramoylalanine--D-glutamate ligase
MKKHLVIGLGQTGLSILQFLQQHRYSAIGFDTRENLAPPVLPNDTPVYLGIIPETIWPDISEVIVSPGVDLNHPVILKAKALQLDIIGDIELFYRKAKAPVIAITGTNAKSTVTTLVTEMIQACGKTALMGGNIGIPALDLLNHPTPDYYVLELSSFQLDLVRDFKAYIGTVLNISPDHLDRHLTMDAYQHAKERVYLHCTYPILNRHLAYLAGPKAAFSFGLSEPQEANEWGILDHYIALGHQKILLSAALSPGLFGDHNLENALSALAIIAPLQLPLPPQLEVLKKFKGLPHRCVLVSKINGVSWYNDSKGTNVGATLAAIKGIAAKTSGQLILLLGGVAKEQDFTPLRQAIQENVRTVIVYGQDRAAILADLKDLPCIEMQAPLSILLEKAQHLAQPGDTVLFSPACASFDMFQDYNDRGEQFTLWASALNSN